MRRTIHSIAYVTLALALLLTGCKSSMRVGTVGVDVEKSHQEFFESVDEQSFQYNTLSARLHVELMTPDKELSSRVDLKMIRDSAFQLSILPMLGIEVFRIEFSRDSVKIVDKLNKRYVAEGYDKMKGKLPVDFNFYNLQALFTNHIFLPGEQEINPKQYNRFKLSKGGSKTLAVTRDALALIYSFAADGEEKLLSLHVTDKDEQYNLYWEYKDFRIVDAQIFPMLMDVRIVANNKQSGKATFSFTRVEPDVPVRLDFPALSRYKQISFEQAIKGLM